jgi:hypothetical protein
MEDEGPQRIDRVEQLLAEWHRQEARDGD